MWTAVILAGFIALSVAATLIVSRLLTCTVLKGHASSFALEMPPFRRPQAGRTLVRSLVDRTLKVLGRAAVVAFPAGAIIWLLANVFVGGESLLGYMTAVLDPLGRIMGLDGVALSAFILGFPANELVLPIAAMGYSAQGELVETGSMQTLSLLLTEAGWSWKTAVSMILFTMMHWPCSTTCLTIYKETGSVRWTLLAIVLPALCGFLCCTAFNAAMILLGC